MIIELTNIDVSSSQSALDALELDDEASPVRGGPPSETSSQEWDKVSDPGSLHHPS
jgi:import receptor subunit TOM20